jgi:hypothetical protein
MLLIDMVVSYFRKLVKMKRKKMIIAIGDVHGKFNQLMDKLESIDMGTDVDFVQVGDFGIGFDSPLRELKKLKELDLILERTESRMWVIRGNHDNPIHWNPKFSYELNNIKFVQDNTFLEIKGKTCFFSGGSISIDRKNRKRGATYWIEENFKWVQPESVPSKIHHVFTHDVYHQCSPFLIESEKTNNWFKQDDLLKQDLIDSQKDLGIMYDFLTSISNDFSWYHGHYHESHFTKIGKQSTHSLSELEFKEVI